MPTEIEQLIDIVRRLRDPVSGCPWDSVQTHQTLAQNVIEEAYEVLDAIERNDAAELCDELGDLLLQIVFHSEIAQERGDFCFAEVALRTREKMVRRHPHIFAQTRQEETNWETIKQRERAQKKQMGALDGVARALPALKRAQKISQRAARVGFDWRNADEVFAKIGEEIEEVRAELCTMDHDRLEDEVGDVLFAVVNLARKLDLDAETCLRRSNDKFIARFKCIEAILAKEHKKLEDTSLEDLEALWKKAKKSLSSAGET